MFIFTDQECLRIFGYKLRVKKPSLYEFCFIGKWGRNLQVTNYPFEISRGGGALNFTDELSAINEEEKTGIGN